MKNGLTIIAALTIACGSALADDGNLIRNGSFELGTDPEQFDWGFVDGIPAGADDVTDWEVVINTIDLVGSYWQASHGNNSIDLNGQYNRSPGAIAQWVQTVPGQTYLLEWDLSGNPSGRPFVKEMRVSGQTEVGTPLFAQNHSVDVTGRGLFDMRWERVSLEFVATSELTRIEFASLHGGPFGPAIDNVSMTVIPAPGAGALAGLGLLACGRRRR